MAEDTANDEDFLRSIPRKLYYMPYAIFSSLLMALVFIYAGWTYGREKYLLVSLVVFGAHLLAREATKKNFDYPVFVGRGFKDIKAPHLACLLVSFILGFFISAYVGVVQSTNIDEISNGISEVIGLSMVRIILVGWPIFLIVYLSILSSKGKIRERYVVAASVILIALQFWIVKEGYYSTILNESLLPKYAYLSKIVLGAPLFWLVKMLFLGFTDEEYKNAFE